MNTNISCLSTAVLISTLTACGGGGGGSNFTMGGDGSDETGSVSIGISDAPVDDVKEVWVEIDTITFRKPGADDVVVDTFTSTDLGIVDADTFQIDLLQYQGGEQAIVIDDIELAAGDYSDMILSVLDEDINSSYVVELDDEQKSIKVPSDTLKLGGFTVDADGVQTFTIDFNLRHAMTYKPGPDEYNLKPRGISLLDNANSAGLSGDVDSALFDTVSPCLEKADPTVGNIVYLYAGHDLDVEQLADVFDPDEITPPADAIEPYAAVAVKEGALGQWSYDFGYVPAGDYTLAFSCNAEADDPDLHDDIEIPLPDDQWYELSLSSGVNVSCNLPITDGACAR
jgi:hypothetical protein